MAKSWVPKAGDPESAVGGDSLSFAERPDGYWGTGPKGRCWHISKVITGWRLDFRDPGDESSTYAGIHGTVDLAKREAGLVTGVSRRGGA